MIVGFFGGNQLLDGSISLSPLCPSLKINLHARISTSLPQSFPWLCPAQAYFLRPPIKNYEDLKNFQKIKYTSNQHYVNPLQVPEAHITTK